VAPDTNRGNHIRPVGRSCSPRRSGRGCCGVTGRPGARSPSLPPVTAAARHRSGRTGRYPGRRYRPGLPPCPTVGAQGGAGAPDTARGYHIRTVGRSFAPRRSRRVRGCCWVVRRPGARSPMLPPVMAPAHHGSGGTRRYPGPQYRSGLPPCRTVVGLGAIRGPDTAQAYHPRHDPSLTPPRRKTIAREDDRGTRRSRYKTVAI
jgi:hypothetical protein